MKHIAKTNSGTYNFKFEKVGEEKMYFSLLTEDGSSARPYNYLTVEDLKEMKKTISKAIKQLESK